MSDDLSLERSCSIEERDESTGASPGGWMKFEIGSDG
jgi:hypothetical protein